MVNVTDKNMDVHSVMNYYAKMKENAEKKFFSQLGDMKMQSVKIKHSIPKSREKKKPVSGVLVTGSTKPREIKGYITTLKRKIDEIMMGDGDMKEKMAQANLLQTKIGILEKIMAEQNKQAYERNVKKRKKIKDKVYLTKDDLTLNGDEETGGVDTGSGVGISGAEGVGENFDAASDSSDVTIADVGAESELDLEA